MAQTASAPSCRPAAIRTPRSAPGLRRGWGQRAGCVATSARAQESRCTSCHCARSGSATSGGTCCSCTSCSRARRVAGRAAGEAARRSPRRSGQPARWVEPPGLPHPQHGRAEGHLAGGDVGPVTPAGERVDAEVVSHLRPAGRVRAREVLGPDDEQLVVGEELEERRGGVGVLRHGDVRVPGLGDRVQEVAALPGALELVEVVALHPRHGVADEVDQSHAGGDVPDPGRHRRRHPRVGVRRGRLAGDQVDRDVREQRQVALDAACEVLLPGEEVWLLDRRQPALRVACPATRRGTWSRPSSPRR